MFQLNTIKKNTGTECGLCIQCQSVPKTTEQRLQMIQLNKTLHENENLTCGRLNFDHEKNYLQFKNR